MAPLLISTHYLILFLVLIHSASLYKIYASDDNQADSSSDLLSSSSDDDLNQSLLGYDDDDDDDDMNIDTNHHNLPAWLSQISRLRQQEESLGKRSTFSKRLRPSNFVAQRRNYRPHWNPLVAAYKRCGELSRPEERESCFKDAIQMLFVHKLRK